MTESIPEETSEDAFSEVIERSSHQVESFSPTHSLQAIPARAENALVFLSLQAGHD